MMWIIFIDWQPYWKCDWTMNIGANRNAHGKRTVSTKQPQVDSWASRLWRGIELVFKSQCDQFFQPGRLLEWRVFHFFIYLFIFFGCVCVCVGGGGGGGGCSAPMHLLFGAVYRSQGHFMYFINVSQPRVLNVLDQISVPKTADKLNLPLSLKIFRWQVCLLCTVDIQLPQLTQNLGNQ